MRRRVLRTKLLPLHPPPPHPPYQMPESKPPVTKKIHLLPMTAHPTPKRQHGTLSVWSACACIPRTRTSASSLSGRRTWIVSHLLGRNEATGLHNGAQTRHLSLTFSKDWESASRKHQALFLHYVLAMLYS